MMLNPLGHRWSPRILSHRPDPFQTGHQRSGPAEGPHSALLAGPLGCGPSSGAAVDL